MTLESSRDKNKLNSNLPFHLLSFAINCLTNIGIFDTKNISPNPWEAINSAMTEGDKNAIHVAVDRFTDSPKEVQIYTKEETKRQLKALRKELKLAKGITRKSIQAQIDLLQGEKISFKRLLNLI